MPVMLGTEDWVVEVRGCPDAEGLAAWLLASGQEEGNVFVFPDRGGWLVWLIVEAPSPEAALTEARRALADSPVRFEYLEVR